MLVSQLIYTGCGKEKTGAFSVWSKSADISKTEENEIREKMIYKRLANLPYEPTPQELEKLFPKKTGYFLLSSGRYCLAQASYIGKVYSDLDQRTGNYIIHAFVFDNDLDILPMMYLNSKIFKKELTYQEWHDQDAPNELPKIEILEGATSISNQEFTTFFDEDKLKKLEFLLQAVINILNTKNKISFYDNNNNLKYWYNALSLCLPANIQKEITFNTIYTPTLSSSHLQNNQVTDTEVKIRNIVPTISNSIFSYRQEVTAGRYAFDFESNIMSNVTVGQYAKVIVDVLKNNVFGASRMANTLGKISLECTINLDTAVTVYLLKNLQINKIYDISSLVKAIDICIKYYPEIISNVADSIYEIYFKNVVRNLSSDHIKLYDFCYKYSKIADKNKMIENYIVNQEDFGISPNLECNQYVESFINKAPFGDSDFIGHLFNDNYLTKYANDFKGSLNKEYLLSAYILKGFKKGNVSGVKFNQGCQFITELIKENLDKKNINNVKYFTDIVGNYDLNLNRKMILDSLQLISLNKSISRVFGIDFILSLMYKINDEELSKKLVNQIIVENINEKGFIEKYLKLKEENFTIFNKVEEDLKKNQEYEIFFDAIEMYKFEKTSNITRRDLERFYNKYVESGLDKGVFIVKLKQYLESIDNKNKIDECSICYIRWYEDADIKDLNVRKGIKIIADIVFKMDIELLKRHIEENNENFAAILYERLKKEDYAIPNCYYSLTYGKKIKSILNKFKHQIVSSEDNDIILNEINKIPNKEETLDILVRYYKKEILELFLNMIQIDNVVELFEKVYQKFYTNQEFLTYFEKEIEKLSDEKMAKILSYMIIYNSYCKNMTVFSAHVKETLNYIITSMNSSRKKKIFNILGTNTTNKYSKEIKEYLDVYNKTHENVFDKIFGGIFKKKEKSKNEVIEVTEEIVEQKENIKEHIKFEEEKKNKREKYVPVQENKTEKVEKTEQNFGIYQVNKNKVYKIHHISEDGQESKRNKR